VPLSLSNRRDGACRPVSLMLRELPKSLRAPAAALSFLTCVPLGGAAVDGRDLARSVAWFPAVGALLGALLAGVATLLHDRLAPELSAVLLLALLAVITGGLHLDGLSDVFDGLAAGRGDRARTLAIMRDPRIGACGAAALFLHLSAKLLAVAALLRSDSLWPLIAAPAIARGCVVLLIVAFPYAREQGLGRPFADHAGGKELALAAALSLLLLAALGRAALVPAAFSLACALCCGALLNRRFGGLTGDAYGAALELSELAFLIAATKP
jgi:adenosylcobinamide-GDP ribazoletransferase